MRSVVCDARNISHHLINDEEGTTVETFIEAVITVMTRKMQFSGSGLLQTEELETLRFAMTIEGARTLVQHIERWIDDAECEHRSLTLMSTEQ